MLNIPLQICINLVDFKNSNIKFNTKVIMIAQSPLLGMPQGPTCKKIQNYIFKFSDVLGQGNFSKVYKAHHEITDEVVAIKIVELNSLKSKKLQQLLFSQINVLKKLNHPNVLRCFQVFTSNRNCYIITELCNEGDLESKLRRRQYFTQEAAQPIIKDIFEGLLYLWDQNVIHRDLKVANVFMHNGRAKVADFGFAKFTTSKFKDINIGSPIYMSPQGFIDNIYGPKTDVWAFGVLIYQLLHGQTPFNFCKTESQLKYNLSLPLNRNKIKPEISAELQQVILKCMEIDQQKRMTTAELAKLPYFQRILNGGYNGRGSNTNIKTDPFNINSNRHIQDNITRTRQSSSYQNTKQYQSNKSSNNMPYENNQSYNNGNSNNTFNRRISIDRNPSRQNYLTVNSTNLERGASPLNGFRHQSDQYGSKKKQNYFSTRNIEKQQFQQRNINLAETNQFDRKYRERGITTQKRHMPVARSASIKSIDKKQGLHIISNSRLPKVISDRLSFKQSVNLLHYGRLIFKYIQLLKQQQNYSQNVQQIYTFTKWLMTILDQVAQKIQNKQITYEGGTNPQVRQKKLIQVTSEYQKKYRRELQNQLIQINLKDTIGVLNLDYMKNFIYNQYLKYDKMLFVQFSKNLICLAHNIMMIYEATRLVKKCYEDKNYWVLENYKDIEIFLGKSKDAMDLDSYRQKRRGMSIYN